MLLRFSNLKTRLFSAVAAKFLEVPIENRFKFIKDRRGYNIKTVPIWKTSTYRYDPIQKEIVSHRNGLGKIVS